MQCQRNLPDPPGVSVSAFDPSVEPIGLGVRSVQSDAVTGELLDVVTLTRDLGDPDTLESIVRERAADVTPPRGLAPIVGVHRARDGRVEVWSARADGFRLSAVLEWAQARHLATPPGVALTVADRLLESIVALEQQRSGGPGSGHGAIAADQIVLSEAGAITLTDYVYGPALARLHWPRQRLWRRFRIGLPPAAGLARFDHRVDVTQSALVVVALLAGRPMGLDDFPARLGEAIDEAARAGLGDLEPEMRRRIVTWLRAATEVDARGAFRSADAALAALREAVSIPRDGDLLIRRWLRATQGLPDDLDAAGAEPGPGAGRGQGPRGEAEIDELAASAAASGNAGITGRIRGWFGLS